MQEASTKNFACLYREYLVSCVFSKAIYCGELFFFLKINVGTLDR